MPYRVEVRNGLVFVMSGNLPVAHYPAGGDGERAAHALVEELNDPTEVHLRDMFAGIAITQVNWDGTTLSDGARLAWSIADAMLRHRPDRNSRVDRDPR